MCTNGLDKYYKNMYSNNLEFLKDLFKSEEYVIELTKEIYYYNYNKYDCDLSLKSKTRCFFFAASRCFAIFEKKVTIKDLFSRLNLYYRDKEIELKDINYCQFDLHHYNLSLKDKILYSDYIQDTKKFVDIVSSIIEITKNPLLLEKKTIIEECVEKINKEYNNEFNIIVEEKDINDKKTSFY